MVDDSNLLLYIPHLTMDSSTSFRFPQQTSSWQHPFTKLVTFGAVPGFFFAFVFRKKPTGCFGNCDCCPWHGQLLLRLVESCQLP